VCSIRIVDEPVAFLLPAGKSMIPIAFAFASLCATWVQVASPSQVALRSVAWTGSGFTAVGDSGVVLSSPDGKSWSVETSGTSRKLHVVRGNDTVRVAGGDSGTLAVSRRGGDWSILRIGDSLPIQILSINPSGLLTASREGDANWMGPVEGPWTRYQHFTGSTNALLWDSAQSRHLWLVRSNTILTSPDAKSWTGHTLSSSVGFSAAAIEQEVVFATTWANGKDGTGLVRITEPIPDSWYVNSLTSISANPFLRLYKGVDAHHGMRIAVGDSGIAVAWTDATSLVNEATPGKNNLLAVAIGDSSAVAVGESGTILLRRGEPPTRLRNAALRKCSAPTTGRVLANGCMVALRVPDVGTWTLVLTELDGTQAGRASHLDGSKEFVSTVADRGVRTLLYRFRKVAEAETGR
jgi:hypothetical protein